MARVRVVRKMTRKDGGSKATLASSLKVASSPAGISTSQINKIVANVNAK